MTKLSEESMRKAKIGQKWGLLGQTVDQVVNAKEDLKEIKSSPPLNTQLVRKWNNLTAEME
jgi:hypothetical protein